MGIGADMEYKGCYRDGGRDLDWMETSGDAHLDGDFGLTLDGDGDYATITQAPDARGGPFTVAFWFTKTQCTVPGWWETIFARYSDPAAVWNTKSVAEACTKQETGHCVWGGEASCSADVTVRAVPGRLSALSVFLLKSILYWAFVWARRALNDPKTAGSGAGRTRRTGATRGTRRGASRVISDCHFSVQLNHFIPGLLSYSVAVFLK
jgi:hypothetical protein